VPAARATFRYFLRRSFYEGEGKAALSALSPEGSLGPERDYTRHILPQAVVRDLREAVVRRRLVPAMRAAAILVGLLAAGVGYAQERLIKAP
jgi:hypothetical protein